MYKKNIKIILNSKYRYMSIYNFLKLIEEIEIESEKEIRI